MSSAPVVPRAISMWDFSWLERRWPGAGYENWDLALDELMERGYHAVRIDAYPHLIHLDAHAEWELLPCWSVNDWGSPMLTRVQVMPALVEFLTACAKRGIRVGLSSWYRRDSKQAWRTICSPRVHAESWLKVLDLIREAGLMDTLLYLDLCNEWPLPIWAPYFYGKDKEEIAPGEDKGWDHPQATAWMCEAMDRIRQQAPNLPLTFSTQQPGDWSKAGFVDFLEPHIWMAGGDFYNRVGYTFRHFFDHTEYENVQRYARCIYETDREKWQNHLRHTIDLAAQDATHANKPLITTECWGVVDYKDGPLLDWEWVKELCALGTEYAAQKGCWVAIGTSNFCGPQFVGMWRDVEWHRRLTHCIRSSKVNIAVPESLASRL